MPRRCNTWPWHRHRRVFDTIQNETRGSADDLIKMMQEWTEIKLAYFNNLYFKNEKAIESLYRLINYENSLLEAAKTKTRRKTKAGTKNNQKPNLKKKNSNVG
jgi:hypothetical protein